MANPEVIDLQTRLSFQEDTIAQLGEVIARQDRRIGDLEKQLRALVERIDDLREENDQQTPPANERPPHY